MLAVVALVCLRLCRPAGGSPGRGDRYLPVGRQRWLRRAALRHRPDRRPGHGAARRERDHLGAGATQDLNSFNLDFTWAGDLDGVTVDGAAADWEIGDGELKVTCPDVVDVEQEFVVSVTYSGVPEPVEDAGSFSVGWHRRATVSLHAGRAAGGEPPGSR